MKTRKERKTMLKFALKMMDKAIEMKQLQILHQQEKNEELRLKQSTPTAELRQFEDGGFPNVRSEEFVFKKSEEKPFIASKEEIDEKLKEEVENDPLFKMMDEIFNPEKNKERLEQIAQSIGLPKGGILVKLGATPKEDVCDCPACQLRRQLEKGENGLN